MSEDQNVEYQLRGARPRRTVRQPPYLQDFELQYAGLPRANVLLPQSPPQAQVSDAFKQYDDEREGDVGSPDSLESSRQALEPWYLTTDRWSEKEDRSLPRDEYSLPPDVQSTVHDLEQENRRLRAAQLSMREEITQLIEIQKSMQKMLINQSQSQGSVPVIQPMTSPEVKLSLNYRCPTDGAKGHYFYLSLNQYGPPSPSYNHQKSKQKNAKESSVVL
ncbi:hypothetical protein QQF64_002424 [Cirrhinus molitorella]|uniref:Uncharacterized protein n=1 Tax=Cirrhinus molitorella TaxID=172907 RepID=A0ABR3MQ55_9TELE